MKSLLRKQEGFTLLELLIVIVIIGILAVLIVPNLTAGPQRARDSQRKSDLRNVKTALETYYNDNNTYPSGAFSGLQAILSPSYIKTVPTDPKTGNTGYAYNPTCASGVCSTYTLTAQLENTKDSQANSSGVYTVNSVN